MKRRDVNMKTFRWQLWLSCLACAIAVALVLRADLAQLRWVEQLSAQGDPPPAQDAHSPSGYTGNLRHFLGTHERGETYRWIAFTQDFLARGPYASDRYDADNVPTGRPQLLPKCYAAWLAGISWTLHAVTGAPLGIAVERAALWEPIIAHLLALLAVAVFMSRRFGATSGAVAALCLAAFPPISGQFLPGVLTPRTGALLLGVYAVALQFPTAGRRKAPLAFSLRSALAASLSLWLAPAFGFPAVLLSAAAGVGGMLAGITARSSLVWSLVGSISIVAAWAIDRAPWDPAAGELRYVHPLYAFAWLGLGVGIDGWQRWRTSRARPRRRLAQMAAAAALVGPLLYLQFKHGYAGWLYPSAAMSRLTSLDETILFSNAADWIGRASFAELAFVIAPVLAAGVMCGWAWIRARARRDEQPAGWPVFALAWIGVVALACLHVRWLVAAALLAGPLVVPLAGRLAPFVRRMLVAVMAVFVLGLFLWNQALPSGLRRPEKETPPRATDLQALVYRHFSHWLATRYPSPGTVALAPPELSDSLVFHGHERVLMSTAWESYDGQIAAARILSAPEPTEAEAVLQSRELTHLVVPSWDPVLPLLVREPQAAGKDTFYARLQRWLLPRYLRAIPYHLPKLPGFLDQQLAVFQVVFPQDEALSLSRLAEYFVEMDRPEPASLAAKVLAESFPDDPNATIARALVYAQTKQQAGFEREVERLVAGKPPMEWNRRVQRGIVLALARRHALAHAEIEACLHEMTDDSLSDLTPLEAYRLATLAKSYGVPFPNSNLAQRTAALGADYSPREP